jgi:hypothetical protein
MKQTAVEWLINELSFIQNLSDEEMTKSQKSILTTSIIKQAKAMEKEQIENAHGLKYYDITEEVINGEQYYNETYNK